MTNKLENLAKKISGLLVSKGYFFGRNLLVNYYLGSKSRGKLWGLRIHNKAKSLILGEFLLVNDDCSFFGAGVISIDSYTYIAPGCSFFTSSHNSDNMNEIISDVHIGKRCWLGAGVTVLPGVAVGDNCIVAACSVVTKDIPANTVVAGVPAKKIRARNISYPYRLPGGNFCLNEQGAIKLISGPS